MQKKFALPNTQFKHEKKVSSSTPYSNRTRSHIRIHTHIYHAQEHGEQVLHSHHSEPVVK